MKQILLIREKDLQTTKSSGNTVASMTCTKCIIFTLKSGSKTRETVLSFHCCHERSPSCKNLMCICLHMDNEIVILSKPGHSLFCCKMNSYETMILTICNLHLTFTPKRREDNLKPEGHFLFAYNLKSYLISNIPQYSVHWSIENMMYCNCQLHHCHTCFW